MNSVRTRGHKFLVKGFLIARQAVLATAVPGVRVVGIVLLRLSAAPDRAVAASPVVLYPLDQAFVESYVKYYATSPIEPPSGNTGDYGIVSVQG